MCNCLQVNKEDVLDLCSPRLSFMHVQRICIVKLLEVFCDRGSGPRAAHASHRACHQAKQAKQSSCSTLDVVPAINCQAGGSTSTTYLRGYCSAYNDLTYCMWSIEMNTYVEISDKNKLGISILNKCLPNCFRSVCTYHRTFWQNVAIHKASVPLMVVY